MDANITSKAKPPEVTTPSDLPAPPTLAYQRNNHSQNQPTHPNLTPLPSKSRYSTPARRNAVPSKWVRYINLDVSCLLEAFVYHHQLQVSEYILSTQLNSTTISSIKENSPPFTHKSQLQNSNKKNQHSSPHSYINKPQLLKMSPILRTIRPLTTRRAFSVVTRVRTFARSFEPHPFGRLPKTQEPAKADWGRQGKRLGDALMFYFPCMGLVMGWPLIAEYVMDGHMT
ncbi:hypothetical protein VTL71DRAFT_12338 [Oculimacula yallundae]|uniref:Uncharacterized protein n=1 Tax=Oculimacula yallundae TaxID=86028 RepID=A0ABR4CMA5_9HELO